MSVHEIVLDDGGMNLLSSGMLRKIGHAVSRLRSCAVETAEPRNRVTAQPLLVLRSGRDHIFAAGADMAEMRAFGAREADEFARLGQELFAAIERLPMLTVAIIDGDCFGGALDLVLAFDLRFATPRSRFAHPGAKLGIVTGFGGTSRWRKVVDPAAARRLFLGNATLSAADAMAIGLVDLVGESFDDELRRLTELDGAVVRPIKELSRCADNLTREQVLLLAERLNALYR